MTLARLDLERLFYDNSPFTSGQSMALDLGLGIELARFQGQALSFGVVISPGRWQASLILQASRDVRFDEPIEVLKVRTRRDENGLQEFRWMPLTIEHGRCSYLRIDLYAHGPREARITAGLLQPSQLPDEPVGIPLVLGSH